MKLLWLSLLLLGLAGLALGQPVPKLPKLVSPKEIPVQPLVTVVPREVVLNWNTGKFTNYWWNLQQSQSAAGPWLTIRSNVSGDVYVTNTGGRALFRLEGRNHP